MRQINWDEPLSEEDKAWARQASLPMVEDRIKENEERFGSATSAEELDVPPDPTRSALDPEAGTGMKPSEAPPAGAPAAQQGVGAPADEDVEEDYDDDYNTWKVSELKREADKRDPVVEYASDARKPDVIAALRAWDREHGE